MLFLFFQLVVSVALSDRVNNSKVVSDGFPIADIPGRTFDSEVPIPYFEIASLWAHFESSLPD